jgi:hypothetical protein
MSNGGKLGPSASGKSDWSSAWEAVSRLAVAQDSLSSAERPHDSLYGQGVEAAIPNAPARAEARSYWSIWILIGGLGLSATLTVASAVGAILYLLS